MSDCKRADLPLDARALGESSFFKIQKPLKVRGASDQLIVQLVISKIVQCGAADNRETKKPTSGPFILDPALTVRAIPAPVPIGKSARSLNLMSVKCRKSLHTSLINAHSASLRDLGRLPRDRWLPLSLSWMFST